MNYCLFLMKVKGKKSDLKIFFDGLTHRGDLKIGRPDSAFHIIELDDLNVFEELDLEKLDDGVHTLVLEGDCLKSINSSFFKYVERQNKKGNKEFNTLADASKDYELDIEIFSKECDLEFQEHYLIYHGKIKERKCVHYVGVRIKKEDTKEKLEKEYGIKISDEAWKKAQDSLILDHGGFEEWNFEF